MPLSTSRTERNLYTLGHAETQLICPLRQHNGELLFSCRITIARTGTQGFYTFQGSGVHMSHAAARTSGGGAADGDKRVVALALVVVGAQEALLDVVQRAAVRRVRRALALQLEHDHPAARAPARVRELTSDNTCTLVSKAASRTTLHMKMCCLA